MAARSRPGIFDGPNDQHRRKRPKRTHKVQTLRPTDDSKYDGSRCKESRMEKIRQQHSHLEDKKRKKSNPHEANCNSVNGPRRSARLAARKEQSSTGQKKKVKGHGLNL